MGVCELSRWRTRRGLAVLRDLCAERSWPPVIWSREMGYHFCASEAEAADGPRRGSAQEAASRTLCARLADSLASPPEEVPFHTYAALYFRKGRPALPALIPQVYFPYDPYTAKTRVAPVPLARQRMDFLLLLPHRVRGALRSTANSTTRSTARRAPSCMPR